MTNRSQLSLVEAIRLFNRKERYWLVQHAVRTKQTDEVPLARQFCDDIAKTLRSLGEHNFHIPEEQYWAVDYHIDWLYGAALHTVGKDGPQENQYHPDNKNRLIRGNQQDVDFLIAFQNTLILIEAKADGGWSQQQLESKIERIGQFYDYADRKGLALSMFFILSSPSSPKSTITFQKKRERLNSNSTTIPHMQMTLFVSDSYHKVQRCDDKGNANKDGKHWSIAAKPWKKVPTGG